MQEEIQEMKENLQAAQSRAFELVSTLTAERDAARESSMRLDSIVQGIVAILRLENPSISDVMTSIQELVAEREENKKTAKPLNRGKTRKNSLVEEEVEG